MDHAKLHLCHGYEVALGGCDMVLGIQWLSSLGTISWDFKYLHMEFMLKGHVP